MENLKNAIIPVVQAQLEDWSQDTGMTFDLDLVFSHENEYVELYWVQVRVKMGPVPNGKWNTTAGEYLAVLNKVDDHYCTSEDLPMDIDGKQWVLGDGDDSLAVEMTNDGFRIWLRHFKYDITE